MKMYFSDATNDKIYIDMKFSENLDFNTFPYTTFQNITIDSDLYTLDMFSITYIIINPNTYRIVIEPKGYIFLYNATFICTVMNPPTPFHRAQNGRPFK